MMTKMAACALVMLVGLADLSAQTPAPAASAVPVIAPDDQPRPEEPTTPYAKALVDYKQGDYAQADLELKGIDPSTQDDNFVILKAHILAELKRDTDAVKVLAPRAGATGTPEIWTAMGDVLLHKRAYERAIKYYDAARSRTHNPDLTLKMIYCLIGSADLVGAEKLASELTPLNPKNPYDDHASYYFAKAAIAQATGKSSDADENIQTARTDYGISVTNRYLKTYLEFFAAPPKGSDTDVTPPPLLKDQTPK